MAKAVIPTQEPSNIPAGDSWVWNKAVPGYRPSDGWALNYSFRGVSTLDYTATADPSGELWNINIVAANTANIVAGAYQWIARVVKGAESYTVASGVLVVTPNVATATAGTLQTHAEKVLAQIETVLAFRLQNGQDIDGYQILGRAVNKIPTEKLYRLRNKYRWEVYRERHPDTQMIPVETHFAEKN